MRPPPRVPAALLAVLIALIALISTPAAAGSPQPDESCRLEMRALLEKTILKLDVLTLRVSLGPADSARVRTLVRSGKPREELADAIAEVAIHSRDARAEIEFVRGASLRQFLGGIMDNLEHVRGAGVLDPERFEEVARALPGWFGFLEERRIRSGDRILYTVRGDRLRTRFRSESGETLLDLQGRGPEHRLAVLGSYFVRGSDLRSQLIESALEAGPCLEPEATATTPSEARSGARAAGRAARRLPAGR